MIPLSNPDIGDSEIEAVVAVLRSSRLSLGPKLVEFESAMASYVGASYAVGISSGTAGLQLGLQSLGINEGDEVILPSFTFIAAANAILQQRATPVFVDIDPLTLNLNPACVEQAITHRTRAIMAVHTFGYPADMDALRAVAVRHGVHLIEDACEALGAEFSGRKVGSIGDFGVFSFYPNKPITTGEGGMLVTSNSSVAATVRAMRNQGRAAADDWLQHSMLGYNYRLPEINCALGVVQLSRIEAILKRREEIARRYCELLSDIETPPLEIVTGRISWFAFVVRLPGKCDRSAVMARLAEMGIESRAYFPPIHTMPLYRPYVSDRAKLSVTERIAARTLALPFFNQISNEQIEQVCRALRHVLAST